MANDVDMWNDIEHYEKQKKIVTPKGEFSGKKIATDLLDCHYNRYNEYNPNKAEKLKQRFKNKYGFWENYY